MYHGARIKPVRVTQNLHQNHYAFLMPLRSHVLAIWCAHGHLRVWLHLASCFPFCQLLVTILWEDRSWV